MERRRIRSGCALLLACLLGLTAGCTTLDPVAQRAEVSTELCQRTGKEIGPERPPGDIVNPPGVVWQDGISEEEAIGLALWNNAAFQELITDLGLARADLIQAGMLPQPDFSFIAAGGIFDSAKFAIEFPIDVLYLRPKRVRNARFEAERATERIVQGGLDLIRDARLAYADLLLAHDRRQLADEVSKLRGQIAELAETRMRNNAASPVEVATARTDALRAKQETVRAVYDVSLAEEKLRNVLGIGVVRAPLNVGPVPALPAADLNVDALVAEAVIARPDAKAAGRAIDAADARIRLAKASIFTRINAIFYSEEQKGFGRDYKPGLRVTVPLWNWNQGAIAHAEAERDRLIRQRGTLYDHILLEVRQAHLRYLQAREELDAWQREIHPAVDDTIHRAEKAYESGQAALVLVLETTRNLLDARLREAQLRADLRRAWAELERSVGRRLSAPAPTPATPVPIPPRANSSTPNYSLTTAGR
jgi:cobalt-zinc-cadmium efflux system outer membrane protein